MSASAVKKFLRYAVKTFPAEHYLVALRGEPDEASVLAGAFSWGITIVQLGEALKAVVDARGGKKVDVWRNYRWAREAIAQPALSSRELASKVASPATTATRPTAARS